MNQEDFPAAKLRQRYGCTIHDAGQSEIGVGLAHARRIAVGVRRCGKMAKASASQHQQTQVSHRLSLGDTLRRSFPKIPFSVRSPYDLLTHGDLHTIVSSPGTTANDTVIMTNVNYKFPPTTIIPTVL